MNPSKAVNPYGVQWQFRVTPRARRAWGYPLTGQQMRDLKSEYLFTGKSPQGIRIHLTVWGEDLTQEQARTRLLNRRGGCRGGVVDRYGDAYTTLHDYDGREPPTVDEIRHIAGILRVKVEALEYSASRRGSHLAITWGAKWEPWQIVVIQAILGSDPKREAYNLLRLMSGADVAKNWRWNFLFSRKLE
jgi:hypothetical protein